MKLVNAERGEVEIVVGGVKGTICAEMGRLATLSGAIGTRSLSEVHHRIAGAEPLAMFAVLATMTISDNAKELKEALTSPADFQEVSDAAVASLEALLKEGVKKKAAAAGNL